MHMADALLSPAVGAALWTATAVVAVACSRRVQRRADSRQVPLMAVLGAFVFAAQMVNFSIPGTGSSGHLGGGLLLAVLVGPQAAFLVIASVLMVQALFFADGGLLALGCNIFNLGFLAAFLAYPLYRRLAGTHASPARLASAAVLGAVLAMQLGALAVVLETVASGISALPFGPFVAFMLPVHLGIGIVEGLVTAAVVSFVRRTRPDILPESAATGGPFNKVLAAFVALTLVTGSVGAWFASTDPDGLEWSIAKVTGTAVLESPGSAVHTRLAQVQRSLAFMPDHGLRGAAGEADAPLANGPPHAALPGASRADTDGAEQGLASAAAGLVGGAITLLLVVLTGFALRWLPRRR